MLNNKMTEYFTIKVFILYLLKNINEPLDFETVNDIVLQDGFVNYFDFTICFSELLDLGQIFEICENGVKYYMISASGNEAVKDVETTLYEDVKEIALRSALRILAFKRSGNKVRCSVEPLDFGYSFKCSIDDGGKTIFKTELFVSDKVLADKMKINFDEKAEIIYKGVITLLSGDVNFLFDD